MPAYWIRQLSTPVYGAKPDMVTRYKRRADRRRNKLQKELNDVCIDTYRWEVLWNPTKKRWAVMPMQNQAIPAPTMKVQ